MKTKICTLIACIAVGSIFMTQPAMGGEVIPLTKHVSVRTGEASTTANARNTTVTSELAPVQQKMALPVPLICFMAYCWNTIMFTKRNG